jgi:hypothetical protein
VRSGWVSYVRPWQDDVLESPPELVVRQVQFDALAARDPVSEVDFGRGQLAAPLVIPRGSVLRRALSDRVHDALDCNATTCVTAAPGNAVWCDVRHRRGPTPLPGFDDDADGLRQNIPLFGQMS